MRIEEVLHRRTDLSTFLVHLTRDSDGVTAKERLASILEDGELEAKTPMGWAKDQDDPNDPEKQSQRVVCFSETPLEHIWALASEIEGRQVQLKPYGLALVKYTARKRGCNPVWYVNMAPGHDWVASPALDDMMAAAVGTGEFHRQPAARVFPFFESMGKWPGGATREFWWEREWRHVGNFDIPHRRAFYLCPEDEIEEFVPRLDGEAEADWRRRKRRFLDPRWGLERIIAHLAGVPKEDVSPFAED